MSKLAQVHSPADVKALSITEVADLAQEIRDFLVAKVSATGGHLGPNLGVVELTLALHRVFNSPHDPLIFDTSHQAYVHKILTGRSKDFDTLRQQGGLSGYTCRAESEHDWTESSHASSSLSVAEGLSRAFKISGQIDRCVVAIVGDGALTGGMCWEALNNIAADKDRNVVVVLNDNGRSYSPTIGGLAENLANLRMATFYDRVMEQGKTTLNSMGWVGKRTFEVMHAFKEGVKQSVMPTSMFSEFGIKYVGPVDGHNQRMLEESLAYAKQYKGPIVVHVVTEKGRGYAPAENNTEDLMHSTGVIDPSTGQPLSRHKRDWTEAFSEELLRLGGENDKLVAITAAMAGPTGLQPFADAYPERFVDVGIAEQHAVASAAGLALGGMHPVVAVYSTFLNRAFDQLVMDVSLTNLPVTIVLDRSGITGSDGASHNGVWDLAICSLIPGVKIAAPRDEATLKAALAQAVVTPSPTVIRFPKGTVPPALPVAAERNGLEIVLDGAAATGKPVLILAVGAFAHTGVTVGQLLQEQGFAATVVAPTWVAPIAPALLEAARDAAAVITIEDGIQHGGIGELFATQLSAAGINVPVQHHAVPNEFLEHATRDQLLTQLQLTGQSIAAAALKFLAV